MSALLESIRTRSPIPAWFPLVRNPTPYPLRRDAHARAVYPAGLLPGVDAMARQSPHTRQSPSRVAQGVVEQVQVHGRPFVDRGRSHFHCDADAGAHPPEDDDFDDDEGGIDCEPDERAAEIAADRYQRDLDARASQ